MSNLTEKDFIIGAIYTAQTQLFMVKKNYHTFEEGRNIILKWMNFGLPEGQYHDLKKYFNKDVSGHGSIMSDTKLRLESEKEAWEALEYFDLL